MVEPVVDLWAGADLDDETKAFVGTKTPAQIAKELKGAQALIGKKVVGVPGPNSTPEEQRAFHEARGVPADVNGYDFTSVLDELAANAPEGWARDEVREAEFRELAKGANLSKNEAAELVRRTLTGEMDKARATTLAAKQADTATENMIVEKWGPNRPAHEANANKFAHHMGLDDDAVGAILKLAGTKPEARFKLVNFFAEQGAMLEEGAGPGGFNRGTGGMSSEQAKAAKEQYLATGDNRDAYLDSGHKNHAAVTAEMTKYLRAEKGV